MSAAGVIVRSNRSGNRSNDWAERSIGVEHNLNRSIVGGGGTYALLRSTIRVMAPGRKSLFLVNRVIDRSAVFTQLLADVHLRLCFAGFCRFGVIDRSALPSKRRTITFLPVAV